MKNTVTMSNVLSKSLVSWEVAILKVPTSSGSKRVDNVKLDTSLRAVALGCFYDHLCGSLLFTLGASMQLFLQICIILLEAQKNTKPILLVS